MTSKKNFITPELQEFITDATTDPAEVDEQQPAALEQEKPKKRRKQKERRTYTDDEAKAILMTMRTNGRKGVKLPRYNIAFRPDIYEFTRTVAHGAGMSYTAFVNMVLEKYMNEHIDSYNRALTLRAELEEEHK